MYILLSLTPALKENRSELLITGNLPAVATWVGAGAGATGAAGFIEDWRGGGGRECSTATSAADPTTVGGHGHHQPITKEQRS